MKTEYLMVCFGQGVIVRWWVCKCFKKEDGSNLLFGSLARTNNKE